MKVCRCPRDDLNRRTITLAFFYFSKKNKAQPCIQGVFGSTRTILPRRALLGCCLHGVCLEAGVAIPCLAWMPSQMAPTNLDRLGCRQQRQQSWPNGWPGPAWHGLMSAQSILARELVMFCALSMCIVVVHFLTLTSQSQISNQITHFWACLVRQKSFIFQATFRQHFLPVRLPRPLTKQALTNKEMR